jgi:hypothetical protein
VPLVVRQSGRARRITLLVCPARRSAILTLPPRTAAREAERFLAAQREWLGAAAGRLPPPLPFRPGTSLPFGDGQLVLDTAGRGARREGDRLFAGGDGALYASRIRRWLVAAARAQLAADTAALAARLGRTDVQVTVGDYRSRWGSCRADGRIAYSWRVLMAPAFVRTSLVAHEVAHLAHPDHGRAFWRLATDLLGADHEPARAWLRAHGPMLHAIGAER